MGMNNKALMMRHLWTIISQHPNSIWVEWIYSNCLRRYSIWTINIVASSSWGWRQLLKIRESIQVFCTYKIGKGDRFWLWMEPWGSIGALLNIFPTIPRTLGIPQEAKLLVVINGEEWNWSRRRAAVTRMVRENLPQIHSSREDAVVWNLTTHGRFTTNLAREAIRTHQESNRGITFLEV
ncbi:hypothetical protein BUALT_Bualt05G0087200 [Buddleja alternifolia]|uniref:Uncharacterized protein n=1 Tax=Buddleja alternifolia TaxID=168488 RepID=A0AAV6XR42_9LAMI|nr:hypothetical protein BUALT_Bualt05G0087200 [Buddleja alternifolia]